MLGKNCHCVGAWWKEKAWTKSQRWTPSQSSRTRWTPCRWTHSAGSLTVNVLHYRWSTVPRAEMPFKFNSHIRCGKNPALRFTQMAQSLSLSLKQRYWYRFCNFLFSILCFKTRWRNKKSFLIIKREKKKIILAEIPGMHLSCFYFTLSWWQRQVTLHILSSDWCPSCGLAAVQ